MIEHFDTLSYLAQIPNPAPDEPPGAEAILGVVSNVKWIAGISLLIGFFGGVVVWVGGRVVDHHRAGRVGVVMILCAIGGGLLYGIGWQTINYFAGAK